jgi:heme/copper-type cytochrome/quinol oxidase subunit 4
VAIHGQAAADTVIGFALAAGAVALYLLPSIVAMHSGAPNQGTIVVVNVFLGWSVIGWIVALAMAVADPKPPPTA